MKTVFIPDVHGEAYWKQIIENENPDRVVFLGDYFDSFTLSTETQVNNFLDIIEYKKTSGKEVILLTGNHDIHYLYGDTGTSGFQRLGRFMIEPVIKENKEHLKICYRMNDIFCTHAGISSEFMDENFKEWSVDNMEELLNNYWEFKPSIFEFNGIDGYGEDTYQTPLWIRPKSLMRANRDTLRKKIIQVVGHTKVLDIDVQGKSTGNRYYFIDTLDSENKKYLVFENGEFKQKSL